MDMIRARVLVLLLRLELFVNSLVKSWQEDWQYGFDKWLRIIGWTVVVLSVPLLYVHASGMCAIDSDSTFCNFTSPGPYNALRSIGVVS